MKNALLILSKPGTNDLTVSASKPEKKIPSNDSNVIAPLQIKVKMHNSDKRTGLFLMPVAAELLCSCIAFNL